MSSNSNRQDGNETYGGKVAEQTDYANRALTYRGRFGTEDRDPKNADRNREIDRAQGGR